MRKMHTLTINERAIYNQTLLHGARRKVHFHEAPITLRTCNNHADVTPTGHMVSALAMRCIYLMTQDRLAK